MKKAVSFLMAVMLLCSLLIIPSVALSAPTVSGVWLTTNPGFTVTPCGADKTPIAVDTSFDCNNDGNADNFYAGAVRFAVKYTPSLGLHVGDNYVILLYEGSTISVGSIHYINQITVSDADVSLGYLTFDVYPSSLLNATIVVTSDALGSSDPVTLAEVHQYLSFKLGDTDEDGKITTLDAVKILQYYVGNITFTDNQKSAADTDRDGKVTTLDAVRILQYYVGNISGF